MKTAFAASLSLLLLLGLACSDDTDSPTTDQGAAKDMAMADQGAGNDMVADKATPAEGAAAFSLTSTAFADKATIPKKHTCEGTDVSPALKWAGAPAGTKAFALIVDDPDAPGGSFIHWLVYDMEPTLTSLSEGVAKTATVSGVGLQGVSGFGKAGYYGPCPPPGKVHNYLFMLYALNKKLGLTAGATAAQVKTAVAAATLAKTTLTGTYKR